VYRADFVPSTAGTNIKKLKRTIKRQRAWTFATGPCHYF
jgi:hypothetical protein